MDWLLDWYWLGVAVGLGVAAGIPVFTLRELRWPVYVAVALAGLGVGLITAFAVPWAVAAAAGGVLIGALFLRRLAPAAVPAAVLAIGAFALVPAVGYLEALAAPLLGARLRRRAGQRYAGLRVLAKD